MPKIIDHDVYKLELAQQAAQLFLTHGYSGLGMRKIASELGVSKSALYHYFPTKEVLFHACTNVVTQVLPSDHDAENETLKNASQSEKISSLIGIVKQIDVGFPDEISLLFDYLRGQSTEDINQNETMKLSNRRYENLMEKFVGKNNAKPVYCLMLGTMLLRYLDGEHTKFGEIEEWMKSQLK